MDYLFFVFFLVSGLFLFVFSRNKRFYEKTAAESGEESAKKTFKILKVGSYFMLLSAAAYLIFFIVL